MPHLARQIVRAFYKETSEMVLACFELFIIGTAAPPQNNRYQARVSVRIRKAQ
jgi:hypothetical protein